MLFINIVNGASLVLLRDSHMALTVSRLIRNLDWNLLKAFHEIADVGSISKAARRLSRKQPALSLALKRLETHLGTILCRRGSGGLRLTDEGELLAEISGKMLGLFEEMEHRLNDASAQVAGHIRLSMINNIVFPELDSAIAAFHMRYPAVNVVIDTGPVESIGRALLRGDADIGIASDQLRRAQLRYDLLFREIQRAYCGRSFHLFGRSVPRLEPLEDEPFIVAGIDEPPELLGYRNLNGLGRRLAGSSDDLDEVKRLVLLGMGIGFLPEQLAAQDVAAGRLWPLGTEHAGWGADIFIITHPAAPRQAIRRLFIEEIHHQQLVTGNRRVSGDHQAKDVELASVSGVTQQQ
jgi:LysR family transcriptional regulator, transcriptional activator for bauABCD operon